MNASVMSNAKLIWNIGKRRVIESPSTVKTVLERELPHSLIK